MCAKWINGYNPEHLVVRLEEKKSLGQDGRVSFNGFGFTEYIVVLNSMVKLNDSITEFEKDNIVRQAAFSLGKRETISSSGLLKEINKFESEYLRRRPQKFVLVSTLSINRSCKLKRVHINGSTITFHPYLQKQFAEEIESKIKKPASYTITGDYPKDYVFLKTFVNAKSYSQASSKAYETGYLGPLKVFDISDWESSFLRLWGLLEFLTNTNGNESHKDVSELKRRKEMIGYAIKFMDN